MSVQEIERQIAELPSGELEHIEKFVRVLRHVSQPGWKERIAQAHARMDAGEKYGKEDLLRIMAERRGASQ